MVHFICAVVCFFAMGYNLYCGNDARWISFICGCVCLLVGTISPIRQKRQEEVLRLIGKHGSFVYKNKVLMGTVVYVDLSALTVWIEADDIVKDTYYVVKSKKFKPWG